MEEKRSGVLFTWIVVVTLIAILFFAVYFLFFAAPPRIEVVLPKALTSISEISRIKFDPAAVVGSPEFRSLKQYDGIPSVGELGRANPFVDYR